MNLSLAITTFNRLEFTIESFAQVLDDRRIDDIIILDDCSTDGSYEKLVNHFAGNEKVRVIRQAKNRGMGQNKRDAISYARNEWVIIFDSDNVIGRNYINAIHRIGAYDGLDILDPNTIYMPDFAKPKFDFGKFSRSRYDRRNIIDLIWDDMGYCAMNCCNYVVHRDNYLKVYKHNPAMKGTDTIYFNYLWLESMNSFFIVGGMQYFHRVHDGSGFLKDIGYNMKQAERIKKMIMSL